MYLPALPQLTGFRLAVYHAPACTVPTDWTLAAAMPCTCLPLPQMVLAAAMPWQLCTCLHR